MKDNNEFYNFAQDLVIDLQNKPNKFIDLDSLIAQLTEIRTKHGNSKVAITTDRGLKFTYLYRVNKEGQVETDCLYPHKNKTLGCTVHHVFIPADIDHNKDHEMDRWVYPTDISVSHNILDYVSIECIGDDGAVYEVNVSSTAITILTPYEFSRDINMKIIETFIVPEVITTVTSSKTNTEGFSWPKSLQSTDTAMDHIVSGTADNMPRNYEKH